MRTFTAGNRETPEVQRLASDVERASRRPEPWVLLETRHAEPDRVQTGMVVLADGSDWNPGSGEGYYGYRSGAWHFLG